MADVPVSYIARVPRARRRRASTTRWRATSRTSRTIDVSASIAQVQRVLDQVIRAVEFLFGFTLAAGLVVLFAAVTRDARGARARVRGDARAGRERHAARAGAARRAARRRRAGRRAGVARRDRRSAGRWRATRSSSAGTPSPLVPLVGARGRRAARAGGRLVGLARGAAPAGGGDAAPGRGL